MRVFDNTLPTASLLRETQCIRFLTDAELTKEAVDLRTLLQNAVKANEAPALAWDRNIGQHDGATEGNQAPGWFSIVSKSICDLLSIRIRLIDAEVLYRRQQRVRDMQWLQD